MNFEWSSLFIFAGIFNAILSIIFLLYDSNRRGAFLLILIILCCITILFEGIIRFSNLLELFPYLTFISTPFFFLIQPILLFYQTFVLNRKIAYWKHLIIPGLICIGMYLRIIIGEPQGSIVKTQEDPPVFVIFYIAFFLFYQVLVFKNQHDAMGQLNREIKSKSRKYARLRTYLIPCISVAIIAIPMILIAQYIPFHNNFLGWFSKIDIILLSLLCHFFMVMSVLKGNDTLVLVTPQQGTSNTEEKKLELIDFMRNHKDYRDPNLTMEDLARKMGWSRTMLSAFVNNNFGTNYYDFINAHRLEELNEKLANKEHQHYSLDSLVKDCGFTNYVSFYRFIKRTKGVTPSEYLKAFKR